MKKNDLTVPAILAEAIGVILGVVYIVLQIYYGILYHVAAYKFVCNIVGIILIYTGLTLLSCYPEKVNRIPPEVCTGRIRKYSIRMLRMIKLVFIVGLMVPCVADVAGFVADGAYSLVVIGIMLFITAYYEYKIIRIMRDDRHDTN